MTPKERDPVFALRACILQKVAQGMARSDAEARCREDAAVLQKKTSSQKSEAASIKAAQGASLGSGAVVREDPVAAVAAWAKGLGRKPTPEDRSAWSEHARRLNMSPDDEAKGWKAVEWVEKTFAALRQALGMSETSAAWGGYSVPNIGMIRMQPSTGPASMKATDSPAWGQPPDASFPFHTRAADKVWAAAKKNILKFKTSGASEILRKSIEDANISPSELTPEDAQLLGMAIHYMQNGPASTTVRTAGNATTGLTGIVSRGMP